METSIPPPPGGVSKRQVVARETPTRAPRKLHKGRVTFLIFCAVFLLVVLYFVLTSG